MEFIKKIKYYFLGNLLRVISIPFCQYEIDPKNASTIFGSRFNNGWNHMIETLKEYDNNPSINYKNTSLYSFLKYFKPISISELTVSDDKIKLPIFKFPWGAINKKIENQNKDPTKSRFCGPSSDEFIKKEFRDIINLYIKLKIEGYQPYRYPNSFIIGTWLTNIHGDSVFMVLGGNHRMAIFAHLGYKKIKVRTQSSLIRKVNEKGISSWLLVKQKQCSEIHAKEVFDIFFTENGKHLHEIIEKQKLLSSKGV